jgi:SAM-dependent methyltransferase
VRERRLIFGEVADTYDRARPGYPDELFDQLVAQGGLQPGDPVLEVGAGTGKATRSLLARGLAVTAVEPSPEMAGVLQRACPGVVVRLHSFDEGDLPVGAFALVTAAQSWHWVTPVERSRRAAAVLRSGGWLAVWWNGPAPRDDDVRHGIDDAYRREAPELAGPSANRIPASRGERRIRDVEHAASAELRTLAEFEPPLTYEFPWSRWYSTEEYQSLLTTYSDHRLLPPETLNRLIAAVGVVLEAHGGGIEHAYVTELVTARRRAR